jgi:hypothetical protein
MSRRIRTVVLTAAGGNSVPADDYTDRIVKFVPADVVAAWLAAVSAVKSAQAPPSETTMWIAFGVACVVAAVWTWRKTSLPKQPAINQTILSTLAFMVWAYATGGTPPLWPGHIYNPLWGSLLLIAFSLVSGLVTKP